MKKWDRALSGIAALGGAWWCADAVASLVNEGVVTLSWFSAFGVGMVVAAQTIAWAFEAVTGDEI